MIKKINFIQLSDSKEIKSTLQELESRNSKLEATIERIAAPNMKAIDRFVNSYLNSLLVL